MRTASVYCEGIITTATPKSPTTLLAMFRRTRRGNIIMKSTKQQLKKESLVLGKLLKKIAPRIGPFLFFYGIMALVNCNNMLHSHKRKIWSSFV